MKNEKGLPAGRQGKFIVIDGNDGSGKATQTKLLVSRLKKNKFKVKTIDFPRYYDNFFGKFIGECLVGEHGDFVSLDPKIASVLYAADRLESSEEIKKWIKEGYIVIADRYASSNQIHQGGKIRDDKERRKFLKWLEKMEYDVFKIPKPDAIFYLDVPIEISMKLLKNEDSKNKKRYSKNKKDLAESNLEYLEKSKESAIKVARENNNWAHIKCTKGEELMSIAQIEEIIWDKFSKMFLKK